LQRNIEIPPVTFCDLFKN